MRLISKARNAAGFLNRAYQAYSDEQKILIYQMGKVGSTTLTRALDETALQIHNFYPANDPCNCRPRYAGSTGRRLLHMLFYRAIRAGIRRRDHLKIIALVRDPTARNLSMFCQDMHYWLAYYFSEVRLNRSGDIGVDLLLDCFEQTFDHRYPLDWFDNEFKRMTGINVYDHEFDRESGFTTINTAGASVLIVQTERLADCWPVIENFCEAKLAFRRENVAGKKWYGTLYRDLCERYSLAPEALDEIYSSEYVKFFFSEDQQAEFRARWQAPATKPLHETTTVG